MKAIVNTGPERLEMLERPLPQPGPGQVRIRTAACSICATDLTMIAGWARTPFGAIPGHEWAGTVDAAGLGADAALVGRPCVADNVWDDGGEVGFEHHGGYAEYFVTQATNVHVLPDDYPLQRAVLIEPLAVAVHALHRLRAPVPGPVLILGDGPIGLLTLLLLARDGRSDIVVAGGREPRLALARRFGAALCVDYHAATGSDEFSRMLRDAGASVDEATRDTGPRALGTYRAIVEAAGSGDALAVTFDVVAPGGRVLVIGGHGQERAAFAWSQLQNRELELIGSNASAGAWDEAVRLAVEERLPFDALITHRLPAARFAEGVALVRDRGSGALKVVLEW